MLKEIFEEAWMIVAETTILMLLARKKRLLYHSARRYIYNVSEKG